MNYKETIIFCAIFIGLVICSIPLWKLERFINWKFSYENKVEIRIQQLEDRIEALEEERNK